MLAGAASGRWCSGRHSPAKAPPCTSDAPEPSRDFLPASPPGTIFRSGRLPDVRIPIRVLLATGVERVIRAGEIFPYMPSLKKLIHEIHRRSLWQVLGIYLAGSWVALEVVDGLTETAALPEWLPSLALALLVIGLPIVLATAFVQEGVGLGEGGTSAAEVAGAPPAADPSGVALPPDNGPGHRIFTWRNAMAGGVAAFAVWGLVAAGWLLIWSDARDGAPPAESSPSAELLAADTTPTVAVLPFANLSADEENAYFADGIHEDVLTQLSKIGSLLVISRTSVLPYRETGKSLGEIGAELGATAVLEGSVRRSGSQVRVVAQLIDARSDAHLWSDTYDRELTGENVFAIQSDVARRVADALRTTLTPEEETRLARLPTDDLGAYDFYLRGREAYGTYTAAANDEALRLYREALRVDPEYALAWAGLGDAYAQRVLRYGFGIDWADSAAAAASRATELDPELAEGHKALGVALFAAGRLEDAVDAYLRAVELNPSHYGAVNNMGVMQNRLGALDEALRWYKRAFRLSPNLLLIRTNIAWVYLNLGEREIARRWIADVQALDPTNESARWGEGMIALAEGRPAVAVRIAERLAAEGVGRARSQHLAAQLTLHARRFDLARQYARESVRLAPENPTPILHLPETILGHAQVETGAVDEGRRHLRRGLERSQALRSRDATLPFELWAIAASHAALGDTERALDLLEQSAEAGSSWDAWTELDPLFDAVRDEPRFVAIVGRMADNRVRMRLRVEREEREVGLR